MLLHDLVFDKIAQYGDRPALLRGDASLSYADFAKEITQFSSAFRDLGIRKGDRIAIYLDKRMEAVVSYLAASYCGAVFVPVNPVLKPAQVAHILNDCNVSILVTSTSLATTLQETLVNCTDVRHVITTDDNDKFKHEPTNLRYWTWNDLRSAISDGTCKSRCIDNDIAAILYTSGSTGRPKGVVLSHRNMVMGAISVADYLRHSSNDVILAALPFSFDAGFSQLTTAFRVGASVVLFDYLLARDLPRAAARYGVTSLTGVPPLWNQIASLKWPAEAVAKMRCIANTGGAMPTATLGKLRSVFPQTQVFLMYGLTESFRSTYLPPEELDNRPTSIGKAIPNAEVLVVREDGSLCEPGEAGELVHRGALVSLGYWNDPVRTAERFRPVPNLMKELPFQEMSVWSGDTVIKDEDGFMFFVGRKDDMIKSSGYRISPTEVEEVIYATGLVSECAALGIPHPTIGQAVVVAATQSGDTIVNADEIIKACKKALPNFMVPQKVVDFDILPKNPNGKIDRKKLASDINNMFQEES